MQFGFGTFWLTNIFVKAVRKMFVILTKARRFCVKKMRVSKIIENCVTSFKEEPKIRGMRKKV